MQALTTHIHTLSLSHIQQSKSSQDTQKFVNERVVEVLQWGRDALVEAISESGFTEFLSDNQTALEDIRDNLPKKIKVCMHACECECMCVCVCVCV